MRFRCWPGRNGKPVRNAVGSSGRDERERNWPERVSISTVRIRAGEFRYFRKTAATSFQVKQSHTIKLVNSFSIYSFSQSHSFPFRQRSDFLAHTNKKRKNAELLQLVIARTIRLFVRLLLFRFHFIAGNYETMAFVSTQMCYEVFRSTSVPITAFVVSFE